MSITNYAELQAAIADWLNRSDLTAVIPDFIELVDARLLRKRLSRGNREATIDDGTGTLFFNLMTPALPLRLEESMVEFRSIEITGVQDADDPMVFNPPLRVPVIQLTTTEQLTSKRSFMTTAAVPRWAAVLYGKIEVAPLPDTVYRYRITYERHLPLNDSDTTTNATLRDAPDVYLYGALVEAAPYIKDDTRLPMWEARFAQALDELERSRDLRDWPNTPIATQPRVFS